MRTKQIWSHFGVRAKASLVWSRITFSRLTTLYFIFACVHCAIQVIFQIQAFSINAAAADTLWSRMKAANQTQEANGFAVLGDDLRICYSVPSTVNAASCTVIWGGNGKSDGTPYGLALSISPSPSPTSAVNQVASLVGPPTNVSPSSLAASSSALQPSSPSALVSTASFLSPTSSPTPVLKSPSISASPSASTVTVLVESPGPNVQTKTLIIPFNNEKEDDDDNEEGGIGDDRDGDEDQDRSHLDHHKRSSMFERASNLDDVCVKALIWPVQKLSDTKREDITFIGFQFWVLGMSIVALLNESIPHTIAALVTHLLATTWAIYQIFETERFRSNFGRLITNGACKPQNLLGSYWEQRRNAEIPSAVLNGVVLIVSAFMTYKLVKIYGWQTFKRVGASLTINRVYRLVLSLSISIQLALFFVVSAMALWIDQLYNGNIGRLASESKLYKIFFIIVFCLLIPWLSLGWFAVRRENRKMSFAFLVLSLVFITLWAAMFDSKSFRWTFVTWQFFTVMAITAGVLMISTFILGLACRFNFGKGLPRYLNAEEPLDGGDFTPVYPDKLNFGEDDPEKVEFPSSHGRPVPTFSAAFGRGPEVPKPTQMHFGPGRAPGTGMYGNNAGQEQQGWSGHTVGRSISSTSSHTENGLARVDTGGSHKTSSSISSGRSDGMGKRWVIE